MAADAALAQSLVHACIERGITIGTAESLTAGQVGAVIADVPGCSAVYRGGVIAYAAEIKGSVLGVDARLLDHVVSEQVAAAMAERACAVLGARLGLATTGVAGPAELDGQPAGTVWIAACLDGRTVARRMLIPGDRATVRTAATDAVMVLAGELLG